MEISINRSWLNEKVTGAKKYFSARIKEELVVPLNGLQAQLNGKTKVRKYSRQVDDLEMFLWKKIKEVQRVTFGDLSFDVEKIEREKAGLPLSPRGRKAKPEKGSSKNESLAFYKQGMPVIEIARQRDMSAVTIEGHLAEFVKNGELDVFDFINKQELEKIKSALNKLGDERLTPLKNELGDEFSYGKIRMGVSYLKKER